MENSEFKNDISINADALDVECLRQPELFYKWAERAVEARSAVDRAKFRLDVTEARCQMDVRASPKTFGLEKVTEASVQATVKKDESFLSAMKTFHEARRTSAMLEKAVAAMEMKKRMLETLITLHGQQYFAGPSTPRNLGQAYLIQKEAAEQKAIKRQTRRVRKPKKNRVKSRKDRENG